MKKGSYYFGLLTEEEKENYKEAVEHSSNKGTWSFGQLMEHEFSSFQSFIRWSFIWSVSNEGKDYWQNIANSNRENTDLK